MRSGVMELFDMSVIKRLPPFFVNNER